MDFNLSIDNITQNLKNMNLIVENGKNVLSIIVDKKFEIILTHYPLWNNEQFLYMIGDLNNKTLLKKKIPEKKIVEIFLEIKSAFPLVRNEILLN